MDFVRCMRRHGIQLADPVVTGRDKVEIGPAPGAPLAPESEFDAATRACEAEGYSRFGKAGDRGRGGDGVDEEGALAFARCVRRSGIPLPDPRFERGAVTNWDPERLGLDLDDATVIAAGQSCARETGFDPWEEL